MFLLDWWLNLSWMNFLSDSRRCLDLVLFFSGLPFGGSLLPQPVSGGIFCVSSPCWSPFHSPSPSCHLRRVWNGFRYTFFLSLSPHLVHRRNHSFLAPTIGGSIITSQALFSTFSSSGPHTRCILGITDSPNLEATDSKLSKWFRGSLPSLGWGEGGSTGSCFVFLPLTVQSAASLKKGGDPLRGAAFLQSLSTLLYF